MTAAGKTNPQSTTTANAPPEVEAPELPPREGIKDTVDSVVVAFILAFVFRAFLIEAFVIPTGSMAATLYGRHGTITCADCGWEFAYGLADQSVHRVNRHAATTVKSTDQAACPNCGYANNDLHLNDIANNAEPGDRILVLKWPFDLGGTLLGPQRWDVTVFKDPSAEARPRSAPPHRDGTQNYIKRLLGLPNEVLEIIDGDVYAVPADELTPGARETLDARRHLKYLRLRDEDSRTPRPHLVSQAAADFPDLLAELNDRLRICRKTELAQDSLWSVVYHHDFPPQSTRADGHFWIPADGSTDTWDVSGRRIRGRCPAGASSELRFAGKPSQPDIIDFCAYNVSARGSRHLQSPVSDLKLETVFVPRSGEGRLELALSKYEDTFWACLAMDGTVELFRTRGQRPGQRDEPLAAIRRAPLRPDQALVLRFQNVDYRVSLSIDGSEILATTDDLYQPELGRLRSLASGQSTPPRSRRPRIAAEALDFELWHVALWRDVYYVSMGAEGELNGIRTGWGTANHPIWLRAGEYFMLGDNSPASKDSRLWMDPGNHLADRGEAYQLGTVPEDQLIGRAFFVYWPAGHRSDILPILRNVGLIPNFGRMRWIR